MIEAANQPTNQPTNNQPIEPIETEDEAFFAQNLERFQSLNARGLHRIISEAIKQYSQTRGIATFLAILN